MERNGEIDILETFFNAPTTWAKGVHPWEDSQLQYGYSYDLGNTQPVDIQEEFHVYAMEWTPSGINFYFDNILVRTMSAAHSPSYPMGMLIGIYGDSGSGASNDIWPKKLEIDYVRIFQDPDGYPEPTSEYVRLKNRWTNEYLNTESVESDLNVAIGQIQPNWWSAQWEKITTDNGYFILRNRNTGKELNIENLSGLIENTDLPDTYWSIQWKGVAIDGYTRLENRWKTDQVIHVEDQQGLAQYGSVPSTHWSSQWVLEQVIE